MLKSIENLEITSRGSGGHSSPEDALFGGEVNLHSWVSPGVVDLASKNPFDWHPDKGVDQIASNFQM